MREIKFRAWDKRYVGGGSFDFPMSYYEDWESIRVLARHKRYEDAIIIMQFTGLKDKNGKEIYEGDVVQASVSSEWDEEVPRNEIAVVEWDQVKYWYKSTMTAEWHEPYDCEWRIIGNIYENPELIGEHNEL